MAKELEQHKLLSTVGIVTEALATSLDLQKVADLVLDRLMEFLEIDCCWIQLLNGVSGELFLLSHRGFTKEMAKEIASLKLDQSLTGHVASTGKLVVIPDISADARYTLVSPTKAGLHSFAATPLRSGKKVIGVLGIASRTKSKFTDQETALLNILGSQIGMAIDRIHLYQQSKLEQEEIALVNKLTRIVSSNLNIEEVYEAFAKELSKSIPVDWASIVLIRGKKLHFYALSSKIKSAWKTGDVIPLEGTATAYIVDTKESLIEPDLSQERKFWTGEYHLKQGISSTVYVPLLAKGEVFGALVIGSVRANAYRQRELTLLNHITGQIAMPIQNALLFEESRKRHELLQSITQLTRIISSDVTLQDIYHSFAQELKKLVDFDRMSIGLIEGDKVRFYAVSDEKETELRAGATYPLEKSDTGWVVKHKKTLIQPDYTQSRVAAIDEVKLKQGLKSSIHVPLFSKGEIFGTLNLSSFRPEAYGEIEQDILEQLAAQVAGAIMNTQLYEKVESHAWSDELTGLFNRRYFNKCLENEIKRHSRHNEIFTVAIIDLDFFKDYNDKYGHGAGDKMLQDTAKLMQSLARSTDLVFRYGGDEFVVLLPNTDTKGAYEVCERLRKGVEVEMVKGRISLTLSIGIASWPVDGLTVSELVNVADACLYQAKQSGGNQTSQSTTTPTPTALPKVSQVKTDQATLGVIHALAKAVEAKDIYTYGHSREVNKYATALAEAIGLSKEQQSHLSTCALLHDIGKIGVPDKVLRKRGKLNDEEWKIIKEHPKLSAIIVSHVSSLLPCRLAILYHHERWDGTGYPAGLQGEEIPLEARILAIADAFTALASARPYRSALSYEKAIEEIKKGAGTQFDPKLAEAFVAMIQKLLAQQSLKK